LDAVYEDDSDPVADFVTSDIPVTHISFSQPKSSTIATTNYISTCPTHDSTATLLTSIEE
jgi:hypothetical protein